MPEKYLNYMNNFRGFVIILIVAVHCVGSQMLQWSIASDLRYNLNSLLHGSSIFYIFIAGFLFKFLMAKYEYIDYIGRKLKYVFLPYLIISIPAIVDEILSPKVIYANYEMWEQIFIYYFTGVHMAHFWFIPVIMIYYIISPLFVLIDRMKLYFYIVPLFLFVAIFVPREINPIHNPAISAVHFMGFYLFGMWVSARIDILEKYSNYYWVGIVFSFLVINLDWILNINQEANLITTKFLYVIKFCILCLTFLAVFKKYDEKIKGAFGYLASNSFGIYFVHNYFIVIFEKILYKSNLKIDGSILSVIIAIIIVTVLSIAMIGAIKFLVNRNSKYIIGC